jgi:hypothetical protein
VVEKKRGNVDSKEADPNVLTAEWLGKGGEDAENQ